MRGFRAKDADRDRYVELIEAAYVDGQIGDADRELRVGRALSAETLDELETLTRDLQRPVGFVPASERAAPRRRQGAGPAVALLLAGLVVFLVLGAVGALVLLAAGGDQDSATSEGVAVAPDPVASAPATEVAEAPAFRMTAPEVREMLRAYEREFGTVDVFEAGFYPTRVGVQVPVRGSRPRYERWTWAGSWRQDTDASAVTGPGGVIDLGRLDVRRLFDNIATARRTLDVERGRLTHVLVNSWSGEPTVNIYIGNTFDETGYLKTTLAGDVVRAYPYTA